MRRSDHRMAAVGPETPCGVERRCVLAPPDAPPALLCAPRRKYTPSHGNPHVGVRHGHRLVASPRGGGTQLTVAHFKKGGPTYDDAMFRLGDIPGPLLLMLPHDIAAALRLELDGCDGLTVG